MAANAPMVLGKISWTSLGIQAIIFCLLIISFGFIGFPEPLIFALFTYVIIARILRSTIAKNHRQGIRLVLQKKFAEAIPYFEKSVVYFSANTWVDKYRSITLLSAAKSSYKEMGLCNIGWCCGQLGDGQKAKEYYEKAIAEFPDCGLANSALKLINSFADSVPTK